MRKIISLNIITVIVLCLLFYGVHYLLLQENRFHISIASLIANSSHLTVKEHILVLGLIPIYIAATIFGAALLGVYLGKNIQKCVKRYFSE